MTEHEIKEVANLISGLVIKDLEDYFKTLITQLGNEKLNLGNSDNGTVVDKKDKTAYQKTELLLYNYNNFKRIIKEKELEIETIKQYGVPKKSLSIVEYSPHSGGTVQGIVLDEDAVQDAIANVQANVQDTVQAVIMVDKAMASISKDPYYKILEMRYFEGRTQDDIALEFNCSQVTISKNKSRLIKELAMRMFPNQAIQEMME